MPTYDFFIAGRWRNKGNIQSVLNIVRASGHSAYCFIENEYDSKELQIRVDGDPEAFMQQFESLDQDDPIIHKVFAADIAAERAAEKFILVFPAGIAGHMEAGAAYGMGKQCYAVGQPEKVESLYCVFEQIFPDELALKKWLVAQ